jgi:hypothetical protein
LNKLGIAQDQISSALSGLDLNRLVGALRQVLIGASVGAA